MEWRIYYADGTTFDSQAGSPRDAPAWGVQVIVQACIESGRYLLNTFDYYVHRGGKWYGVDGIGALDYLHEMGYLELPTDMSANDILLRAAYDGLVKVGRTLRERDFIVIFKRANEDPDFPPRVAVLPTERVPERIKAEKYYG